MNTQIVQILIWNETVCCACTRRRALAKYGKVYSQDQSAGSRKLLKSYHHHHHREESSTNIKYQI